MTAAVAVPLGTVAKSVSTHVILSAALAAIEAADPGARRFMRQAAARYMLLPKTKWAARSDGTAVEVPAERVCGCLRWHCPGALGVELWHDPKHQAAHYKQLVLCASVWACAVCAARITEKRRVDLSGAIKAHTGQIGFVTLTLQHNVTDKVGDLADGLTEAARLMRGGRRWRQLEDRYGFAFEARGLVRSRIGTVRALENTTGPNGHHPHLHYLMFLRGGIDFEAFEAELRELWLSALARVGRYASAKWAIKVEHTDADIADYVAKFGHDPKWTSAHEVAKPWSKSGGAGHFSMGQLLDVYVVDGDPDARRLWLEYYEAFKGKHQLVWSDGLRAVLLPDAVEQSDQDIVNEAIENASYLAMLDLDAWRVVLGQDARYELLQAAAAGDVGEIRRFLLSIGISEGVDYAQGQEVGLSP